MKHFLQLATHLPTLPLLLALKRQPALWQEDTYLRNYPQGPFGEVESVILRFPPRYIATDAKDLAEYEKHVDQHECVDLMPYASLPEARGLVSGLMALTSGERLGRIIINKVNPGGRIHRHADTPAHANYWDRFHIVLDSLPGARFLCGEGDDAEEVYMAPGEAWWFQNAEQHEVINNSERERIHMVVDIRTPRGPQPIEMEKTW